MKNYSEPGTNCVEFHINPLRNLDWILGLLPRIFPNKRQPADTQATLGGQLARSLRTNWQYSSLTDRSSKVVPKDASISSWKHTEKVFSISVGLCLKEVWVTQDSTDCPQFAVNSAVALWQAWQGLIILCPACSQNVLEHIKVSTTASSGSLLGWVSLRIHSALPETTAHPSSYSPASQV